eukprot:5182520-Amphidinium_carterae.1
MNSDLFCLTSHVGFVAASSVSVLVAFDRKSHVVFAKSQIHCCSDFNDVLQYFTASTYLFLVPFSFCSPGVNVANRRICWWYLLIW